MHELALGRKLARWLRNLLSKPTGRSPVKRLNRRLGKRQPRWIWTVLLITSCWIAVVGQPQFAVANSPTAQQMPVWQQAIVTGIDAYDNGSFSDAIARWKTALSTVDDRNLSRAYILSNLATAYERLGQRSAAQAALSESLDIVQSWPTEDSAYWEVSARVLNTQGQVLWQSGQTQQALDAWQQAEAHYRAVAPTAAPTVGLVSSQINQALALQELGFNAKAARQLTQLRYIVANAPLQVQLVTLRELGKALRRVGDLAAAQTVLTDGIEQANSGGAVDSALEPLIASLNLELGHTLRSLSHRAIAIGKTDPAQRYAEQTLQYYSAVSSSTEPSPDSTLIGAQAQLNQLSYLIETGQLASAQMLWPQIRLDALPAGRDRTEAHISYAHSLICLQAPASVACTQREWRENALTFSSESRSESAADAFRPRRLTDTVAWERIGTTLQTAVRQAQALSDPLLEAYALGELAHAYELTEQWPEAIRLTTEALTLIEGQSLPEVAYRLEWQLGRLYRDAAPATSQISQRALSSYQQAITSLSAVRRNLLAIDPQAQFSFQDSIEPLHREYVALLISRSQETNKAPLHDHAFSEQSLLNSAVQALDALQLTELENFLGCDLSQLIRLNETAIDLKAAKIYPILLPDQLAIIINIPGQPLALRTVEAPQTELETTLRTLRRNLALPGQTPAVLTDARQLHQWLIDPLQPILSDNPQIETLVFVPDGLLRNIPMGVLYDGEKYLVEGPYAIAISPQLSLFSPRPTPAQLKVLRGGVDIAQTIRGQRFPPIELVQAELNQIPAALTVAPPLLNEAFTQANIEQQLANFRYSAIHWKTHGVFSADPAETFLVAYQEGITANELSALLQSARLQQLEPIELLVLSACETAQGDRRAVLGLAGMSVRAGARSTLSTLWRADDGANTQLMSIFYQGLSQGLTKAQALQAAQKALLTEAGYPAPYYWASYVLVGNWL